MIPLLRWAEAPEKWMREHSFMAWLCHCGAEVSVVWSNACPLLDVDNDEAISEALATSASWQIECHDGHVLLLCHELADDQCADTFAAPTTREVVERLASPEDVAAWAAYSAPKPPWAKVG